jgi:hypothetical protein
MVMNYIKWMQLNCLNVFRGNFSYKLASNSLGVLFLLNALFGLILLIIYKHKDDKTSPDQGEAQE